MIGENKRMHSNNDFRNYLSHHGILGMHWGRKNGPPYPLGPRDHSASEKKAGWRKSLGGRRNEEDYGKKHRIKKSNTKVTSTGEKSEKVKKALKVAAVVGITAVAAYGAYKGAKYINTKNISIGKKALDDACASSFGEVSSTVFSEKVTSKVVKPSVSTAPVKQVVKPSVSTAPVKQVVKPSVSTAPVKQVVKPSVSSQLTLTPEVPNIDYNKTIQKNVSSFSKKASDLTSQTSKIDYGEDYVRKKFNDSISLARRNGVSEKDILKTKNDIDKFFMG